jgi:hypothetical protein
MLHLTCAAPAPKSSAHRRAQASRHGDTARTNQETAMKTDRQASRPTRHSARIEELADLLLDDVDDDVDGFDGGLLHDVGLRGRGGAYDFGADESAAAWR